VIIGTVFMGAFLLTGQHNLFPPVVFRAVCFVLPITVQVKSSAARIMHTKLRGMSKSITVCRHAFLAIHRIRLHTSIFHHPGSKRRHEDAERCPKRRKVGSGWLRSTRPPWKLTRQQTDWVLSSDLSAQHQPISENLEFSGHSTSKFSLLDRNSDYLLNLFLKTIQQFLERANESSEHVESHDKRRWRNPHFLLVRVHLRFCCPVEMLFTHKTDRRQRWGWGSGRGQAEGPSQAKSSNNWIVITFQMGIVDSERIRTTREVLIDGPLLVQSVSVASVRVSSSPRELALWSRVQCRHSLWPENGQHEHKGNLIDQFCQNSNEVWDADLH
jgi:hypothetical protein